MEREIMLQQLGKRLVAWHVLYNVSPLVAELLKAAFEPTALIDESDAFTLTRRAADADDYRENAPEGAGMLAVDGGYIVSTPGLDEPTADDDWHSSELEAWSAVFDELGQDHPEGQEIYEHWLVSEWLADQLILKGEAVARDVLGLTIWGRCTSGQAICLDSVIQDIALELYGESGAGVED